MYFFSQLNKFSRNTDRQPDKWTVRKFFQIKCFWLIYWFIAWSIWDLLSIGRPRWHNPLILLIGWLIGGFTVIVKWLIDWLIVKRRTVEPHVFGPLEPDRIGIPRHTTTIFYWLIGYQMTDRIGIRRHTTTIFYWSIDWWIEWLGNC